MRQGPVADRHRDCVLGEEDGAVHAVRGDVQDPRSAPFQASGQLGEFQQDPFGQDVTGLDAGTDDGELAGEVVSCWFGVAGAGEHPGA